MSTEFAYTDGVEIEAFILEVIRRAPDLGSDVAIAPEQYGRWPVRYHLCPERANLFRHLDFTDLDVCELGAGMGGVSRYLAEHAKTLTVVEGSEARFAALSERLRDLNNWSGVVKNLQDFQTEKRFDVVCLVGVLEYSEVYIDRPDPFLWVLRHVASLLKEDGVLLLAIENKLGLKYWAGAPEDHTGRMFDGIEGYSAGKSPRTFSRDGLRSLLDRAGYARTEEFYPWPDYKTPLSVVSRRFVEVAPRTVGEIAFDSAIRAEDRPLRVFPESLAAIAVAEEGLIGEFANSFLFASARTEQSRVLAKLLRGTLEDGDIGWHYSASRKSPTRTAFRETAAGLVSVKSGEVAPGERLRWSGGRQEPILQASRVSTRLARHAYFGEREAFDALLDRFLRWTFSEHADGDAIEAGSLDVIATNAVLDGENFVAFDLEWVWDGPISRSWLVLRNLVTLRFAFLLFEQPIAESWRELYESICRRNGVDPDFEQDVACEVALHDDASRPIPNLDFESYFRRLLNAPIEPIRYPRDPAVEEVVRLGATSLAEKNRALEAEVARLKLENHNLSAELTRKAIRVALAVDRGVRKVPGVHAFGRFLVKTLRGSRSSG